MQITPTRGSFKWGEMVCETVLPLKLLCALVAVLVHAYIVAPPRGLQYSLAITQSTIPIILIKGAP